jgi:hypothetical protein
MKKIFLIVTIVLSIALVFTACSGNDTAKTEQLAKDEMYTCTMHQEVMSDHPGDCPKCGMKLVKQQMTAPQQKMMNEGTYVKPKE